MKRSPVPNPTKRQRQLACYYKALHPKQIAYANFAVKHGRKIFNLKNDEQRAAWAYLSDTSLYLTMQGLFSTFPKVRKKK
jgi:hypothetical protein